MKHIITSIVLCLFLTVHSPCCFSQENGFLFRDINLPESFSEQIITLVERDNAGLLWFVTNSGLYRYDGNEAIRFDKNSNPVLAHSTITDILADKKGNLWIGGPDGLTRFDLKAWKTSRIKTDSIVDSGFREQSILSIGQRADGSIYAGTRDGKLYQVVDDSLALVVDINRHFKGLFPLAAIYTIEEPYPGELWLTTEIGKMIRIKIASGEVSPPEYFGLEEYEGAAIRDVYFHPSGKCIFYVPRHGLYLFNTRTGSIEKLAPEGTEDLGENGVAYIAPFNQNEALIFTNHADIGKEKLFRYHFQTNTTTMQLVSYPDYLKNNHIDWFRNTGNALLMSLNNLIVQLVPVKEMFTSMFSDPVAINSIRSVYKHPDGRLFVGSYKERFISFDEDTGKKTVEASQFVYDILHWNADTLLLSTEGDGLFWYEINKHQLTPLTLRPSQEQVRPAQNYMTTLVRASRDSVWVGTYTGLLLVNPYTQTYQPIRDDHLVQAKILSLLVNDEKLWIGTPTGLAEWNPLTDSLTYHTRGDPVYCITPVGTEFWIGTEGNGIWVLDKDGLVKDTIDNSGGLTNDIVYSLEAEGKYVVAATQNGISVIDRESELIQNYSRLDQLPANEFNHAASFHLGDTVYLGSINGLVSFSMSEASVPVNSTLPEHIPIYVTSLTTERSGNGTQHNYSFPYQNDREIVIEAGTRYFSVGFGGLSEYAPQLQYYYRIGSQTDWFPLGNRQEIAFVEMPPGDYQLELTARLPDGQQTGSVLEVPLLVKPAPHQTVWFKGLIVLFISAIIWGVFRYRENVLQQEKKLRIKIASDLHDEVGSSLTRIYFQADMLASGYLPAMGGDKQLQQIADTSKNALFTMSDMVWSIDSRFDTVQDLVNRMKDYMYRLREELDIDYRFDVQGNSASRPASQIVRQNLFLIFKESLTNAIKYGDGSKIVIELNLEHSFKLVVTNRYSRTNESISAQQGGRGIQSMQQRAAKMDGQLSCTAEDGLFLVTLYVP